jgi:hypothetical protein
MSGERLTSYQGMHTNAGIEELPAELRAELPYSVLCVTYMSRASILRGDMHDIDADNGPSSRLHGVSRLLRRQQLWR